MLEIKTLDDISALSENFEVECKLAAGKDGKGELPKDFWPTYSAFSNSYGGDVILGIKEAQNGFKLNGIINLQKVMDDLWSTLNDPGHSVSSAGAVTPHCRPGIFPKYGYIPSR